MASADVDEYYEGLTECAKTPPQTARYVLPTCLATKLYMTNIASGVHAV